MQKDKTKKKMNNLKGKKKGLELFLLPCKYVPNLSKKRLDIFSSFKIDLQNSNYFKSMKMNFV